MTQGHSPPHPERWHPTCAAGRDEQAARRQAVDPSIVYFRTVPTFETAAPRLQWLTRAIVVGSGERHFSDVIIRVWKVE